MKTGTSTSSGLPKTCPLKISPISTMVLMKLSSGFTCKCSVCVGEEKLTHSTSFLFTFEEFAREMIFLVDTMEEVRIWPFVVSVTNVFKDCYD